MIKLVWLYEKDMNVYGDRGNILAIKNQARLRGIELEIVKYNPGDTLPDDADIIIGGGGQDSGQDKIQSDLLKIGPQLKKLADKNVPMLMICGLFQLFGDDFTKSDGEKICGISLLKGVKTVAGKQRLIGNLVEQSDEFGEIVGYENHSGQTYLPATITPLAKVKSGEGNSLGSGFEGARYKNVIGTYMHGALLPKNPQITLFLLEQALKNRGESLPEISKKHQKIAKKFQSITEKARQTAISRPR